MLLLKNKRSAKNTVDQERDALINALNRVQAVIWFELDSTIIEANDNFLNAMGYEASEIVGQKHRIFCEPGFANSSSYTEMWERLRRGEPQSGVFKRLSKNGSEVWIEASYNPVLDENGTPVKIVKFAIDVSRQKNEAANHQGQIDAISRSQATIEFSMDGTIKSANKNFLDAMGYDLAEIVGKKHSLFIDPKERDSAEYKEFWAALGRGEFKASEFKRFGKNGKVIWIQATYNPIFNSEGKPFKVVKFATDITQRKNAIDAFKRSLRAMASGDLTARIDEEVGDDLATLKDAFNSTTSRLSELISQVKASTSMMSEATNSIVKSSQHLSSRAEEQASSLEETSAAMEEMSANIRGTADNANGANNAAVEASNCTKRGSDVVTDAVEAMENIESSSANISDIITVIESISFQTNLLALNAAVEAARAGDAGKGFAVVASEVRTLAQRSSEAAKDITALIQSSAQHVKQGAGLVRESGEVLVEINEMVAKVEANVKDIATASQEQSGGVREITTALANIDSTTQQNADLSSQCAKSAAEISQIVSKITEIVGFFQADQANRQQVADHSIPQRLAG